MYACKQRYVASYLLMTYFMVVIDFIYGFVFGK